MFVMNTDKSLIKFDTEGRRNYLIEIPITSE